MVSPGVDCNHPVEDSHPYNSLQKPEARANRGPPKQLTPAQSPEGKPASNGRRRTRTKVVAWDPKDLEDIYVRKEVNKEDWDTICRDYPSRTRVAMRQQVIKMREKKQREALGLGHGAGKSSTYSDSPQPASNGIKWASVNGYQSSPAEADSYHQRLSVDGEESSDDFDFSSAPDSDHEGKMGKQFDLPARSPPSHSLGVAMPEIPPQQPIVPSMPIIAPEGFQANRQHQPEFDVLAAQSRGQPIAPRQLPPKPSSTSAAFFDYRSSVAPDFRVTQRTKRGRDFEAVDSELQSTDNFHKRRKHQMEATDPSSIMVGVSEECAMPFNLPQTMPVPLLPPRIPSDSELDEMCIQFREKFRMMAAYYYEEQRISKNLFDAAIDRANARAAGALQKLDEANLIYAEQAKEARLSSQIEHDLLSKKLTAEISENSRLAEELSSCRHKLAAANETPERKTYTAVAENIPRPDVEMNAVPQSSLIETLQQELLTVKEDAKRADVANNLLDEEAAKMRRDGRDTHSMVQEVKRQHDRVTAKIDHLVSQDLQDLTNKEVKKYIMDVKAEDQGLSNKVKQVEDFLNKPNHLTFGAMHQSPNIVANGSVSKGPT
ncbi:MAG: hypothetical protein L6R42_007864 [Xanthoria sp. 1 TBL-2021]|nr:MAG: hypothetical protein L6R42_007864 [Xanthoria sp. 1 TBL-2021]